MDEPYLDHSYELAGRRIDPVVGTVTRGDERSSLRRKELEVLALLASAEGRTVRRDEFIGQVWDGDKLVGERGLTDTIYALRRSLADTDSKAPLIRTIPRRGYQLKAEVQLLADRQSPSFATGWRVPGRSGWQLDKLLSRSDVAETWQATRPPSGERRVFRFCRSEQHLRRLRREVTVLRFLRETLANHQGVAGILAWQLEEPPYFLEMEPTAHGTLADWSASRGGLERIPLDERVGIIAQAADALDAVHSLGVVHRNLSPASLLLDEEQGELCVKLGDFGLGTVSERSQLAALDLSATGLTFSSGAVGTDAVYLAPEVTAGESPQAASDVYALGVVLFQVACGDWHRPLIRSWRDRFEPADLRPVVAACLAPRADERPSASELCQRLRSFHRRAGERITETELQDESPVAPMGQPSPPGGVGRTIGPYRLLKVLGEGGMGTVYLAEQQHPVERTVALKLIKAGMDSEQVLARFEAERQALALMNHDNVAAVHDAGTSVSGHPYFVMEHVPGRGVTDYCDHERLGLRARIELFLEVCRGVQHAHQRGLIHRDLKPSNILVKEPADREAADRPATVKIIDFGVAKSLQRKLSDRTIHTHLGSFVGTPRYSSPEQISGHLPDVDTRSDVYSLGVVLYELVTGVTPLGAEQLAGKSSAELADLLSREPTPPRSRFDQLEPTRKEEIARNRARSVAELADQLDTDLSWIILKCLEPDPDDRYPSVLELQKDLSRWLSDRPIEARPSTRLYRLGKLARRHRRTVAAAALIAVALIATTTIAVVGFVRAENEAAKARTAALEADKAAEFQVRQLQTITPSSMAAGFRQSLRRAVVEQRRKTGSTTIDDDQRQLDRLLQGVNFTDLFLEQLETHFFEPALQEIEASYQEFPLLQARLREATAETLGHWGNLERAVEPQGLALDARRALLGADDPLTLISLRKRGSLHHALGLFDEAEADLRSATTGLREALGTENRETLKSMGDLGFFLFRRGKLDEAEQYLGAALDGQRRILGDLHPDTLRSIYNLANLLEAQGRFEQSEAHFREGLKGQRQTVGEDHLVTLGLINDLGTLLRRQDRLAEAEVFYRDALAISRRLFGEEHEATLVVLGNLAELLGRRGQLDEAERLQREAGEALRRLLGERHPRTLIAIRNLATVLQSQGELTEAETLYRKAVDGLRQALGDDHPTTLKIINGMARLLRERGRLAEAEALAREALDGLRRVLGDEHQSTLRPLHTLGTLLMEQGRLDEAEPLITQALEAQQRALGTEHTDTLRSLLTLGDLRRAQGELEQAEARYREALAGLENARGENTPMVQRARRQLAQVLREAGRQDEASRIEREAGRLE